MWILKMWFESGFKVNSDTSGRQTTTLTHAHKRCDRRQNGRSCYLFKRKKKYNKSLIPLFPDRLARFFDGNIWILQVHN